MEVSGSRNFMQFIGDFRHLVNQTEALESRPESLVQTKFINIKAPTEAFQHRKGLTSISL